MQQHFRSLIIINSDVKQIIQQLVYLSEHVSGDWITVTSCVELFNGTTNVFMPKQAKQLLGREFKHAIFDATQGFNLDAFAILAGTLVADSMLLLLLPSNYSDWQDHDSLRWNEQLAPITVPNFVYHLNQTICKAKSFSNNIFFNKINDLQNSYLFDFINKNITITHSDNCHLFKSNTEQSDLLNTILASQDEMILLTAKRGRGKSALAGMFTQYHDCWITAPNKNSVSTLRKFAKADIAFFAPDDLIHKLDSSSKRPKWLIIDEAAMIPLPMLKRLLSESYYVLLTTTIDGYEGTGQGLLLKLFKHYENKKKIAYYHLSQPIRWPDHDPLEYFVDSLIVANSEPNDLHDSHRRVVIGKPSICNSLVYKALQQKDLLNPPETLSAFFGLLKSAHYRTSLIDLRRLLDATKVRLYCATYLNQMVGALIAIEEGGLPDELIDEIWKGNRRPKGNLVAQSFVAHAGERQAAKLYSIRINRIAVKESMRQQGVATKLIQCLLQACSLHEKEHSACDFISVSFAYSQEMHQFWSKLGFTIVHVGTHREASSGSYAVMAIYPISEQGHLLRLRMQKRFARNWYWLRHWVDIDLTISIDDDQSLSLADKFELLHFATTHYSYTASLPVLSRLAHYLNTVNNELMQSKCPLLYALMIKNLSQNMTVEHYRLLGKDQLLSMLRKEIHQLITTEGLFNE